MSLVLAVMSLPETTVNSPELISTLIQAGGAIVCVAVAGWVSICLLKKGSRWLGLTYQDFRKK